MSENYLPSVAWDDGEGCLLLLDQTKLPREERLMHIKTSTDVHKAIWLLEVRGAPAIGVAAAFGLYLGALEIGAEERSSFLGALHQKADYLASARPTAVNLSWALARMLEKVENSKEEDVAVLKAMLLEEAKAIRAEDIAVCEQIGKNGLALLRPQMGILTHCNAGRLATVGLGTALAPIYLGQQKGYDFRIYADETRPFLQGARLTSYELTAVGINTTLICDNMAAVVMAKGMVDAVLVGCDRVAKNGDTANKIGTYNVALLAKYFAIPFYVCAPLSTVDLACPNGQAIPIEERPASEVRELWYSEPMAPAEVKIYNPAFDITPAELITAFITEKGVFRPGGLGRVKEQFLDGTEGV